MLLEEILLFNGLSLHQEAKQSSLNEVSTLDGTLCIQLGQILGRAPEACRAGATGSVEALPGLLSARRFYTARLISTACRCIVDTAFLCCNYFTFRLSSLGRQLTIFNTQATVAIGGSDRSRPFQGQLSGLYYNGLKVLSMAAEGNANIKINGSVRLVGDVPSVAGSARSTAMPPEMSTTFIETTTMMSTTTTRKHRSSSTVQVRAASSTW